MKKNLVTGLLMCAIVGTMLTGCGDNKEVTKVDESTAVITETTESTEESTEEKVTDPIDAQIESETETVEAETEEVAEDFLSKNGLVITPQGSQKLLLTPMDSDEVEEMDSNVTVVTVDSDEEGYVDTTATFEITMNSSLTYYVTAFDRYTGTCLESHPQSFETNEISTKHDNVCVVDVDGKQYDCGITVGQSVDEWVTTITLSVHHPKEYDGVVFQFGKLNSAQKTETENIDYNTAFTVDQYPVLLEGQYFFTATDN